MRVGEFQKAIGATPSSYSGFMSQHGPRKGSASCVYYNAWAFFKRRELRGIKPPSHVKKPKAGGPAAPDAALDAVDELPGEKEERVPIYGMSSTPLRKACDELSPNQEQIRAMISVARSVLTLKNLASHKPLS